MIETLILMVKNQEMIHSKDNFKLELNYVMLSIEMCLPNS